MLKLNRIRTKSIPKAFRGEDRVNKLLDLLKAERDIQSGKIKQHEFPSLWSPCKKQLLKESNDKCAYCESPTTVVAYGDVEHFRPKSKYWWLAYCYDNYLASCTLCNQKYKKAKFKTLHSKQQGPQINSSDSDDMLIQLAGKICPDPCIESEGMPYLEYETAHNAERPLLLNPYIDDPSIFFAWEVDHIKGYVKLIASDLSDELICKIITACEEDFGINRKELCQHRYDAYLAYAGSRLMSEDPSVPVNWRDFQLIRKNNYLKPESAYTGMLLYFESLPSSKLSLPAI